MAKTPSRVRRTQRVGPQAAPGTWSPEELLEAIGQPSRDEKLELLRTIGILDASGKLAKRYRSWESKVSRTPEE
jgi:hypothetical protein